MVKLSELIANWILKKGITIDIDELATDVDIPDTKMKVHIQAKQVKITLTKNEEK
mgnify:CR=1 FL=1